MIKVLTSPHEIKQFLKHLIHEQIEAYFDRVKDDEDMLLAVTDTQSQADQIKAFLLRSKVLADRRFMDIAVQRIPNLSTGEERFPVFGVFYVSGHLKADRARVMNNVLAKIIMNL